jgi:polysaccharide pyruvyl transferase WcaK-like protein
VLARLNISPLTQHYLREQPKLSEWLWPRLPYIAKRYASVLRLTALPWHFRGQRSALFIAPAGAGSLGDAAMITAGIEHLQDLGFDRFGVVYPYYWQADSDWTQIPSLHESWGIRFRVEDFPEGIEVAIEECWKDYCRFVHMVMQYSHVYCIGADIMDGFYSVSVPRLLTQLSGIAAASGAKSTIVGFSFNENPARQMIGLFRQISSDTRLCCRDPISHERFEKKIKCSSELVADAAFLLKPRIDSDALQLTLRWLEQKKCEGNAIIGINVNPISLSSLSIDSESLVAAYINTLEEIKNKIGNCSFLLIPHDLRGNPSDLTLLRNIFDNLSTAMKDDCWCLPSSCSAANIKGVCSKLDIVVTGRMHLAIAALGQGKPPIGITYQGKFEGLYRHFDLQGLALSPVEAFQQDRLVDLVVKTWVNREPLQEKISAQLDAIYAMARKNFRL